MIPALQGYCYLTGWRRGMKKERMVHLTTVKPDEEDREGDSPLCNRVFDVAWVCERDRPRICRKCLRVLEEAGDGRPR